MGTRTTVRDLELCSHGIQVQATVEFVTQQGRNLNYLVEYALQDGTQESAWIGDLGSRTKEGNSVEIVYQRSSPCTIDTPFALSRWWITLFAAPFGAFSSGSAGDFAVCRPRPTCGWLRARYGGR